MIFIRQLEEVLTLRPILNVLSVLRSHKVRFQLIRGQACVLLRVGYEFSRGIDLAILAAGSVCEYPKCLI